MTGGYSPSSLVFFFFFCAEATTGRNDKSTTNKMVLRVTGETLDSIRLGQDRLDCRAAIQCGIFRLDWMLPINDLDPQSDTPLYRQIFDRIRVLIDSGRLEAG